MNQLHKQYRGQSHQSTFEDRDRLLIRLLAEERNSWISGCCLTLWLGVHRYRSLLKKYYKLDDEKKKRPEGGSGVSAVPVAIPTTQESKTTVTVESKKGQ